MSSSGLKKFDLVNLRLRIISALILIPIALLAVWLGGLAYGALTTVVLAIGLYEWMRLVRATVSPRLTMIACFMLIVTLMAGGFLSPTFGAMIGVFLTLALFLVAVREGDDRAGWIALGIPYMGGSGLALLALRAPDNIIGGGGAALTFYLFVTVWGTDIGAFIAGRLIGGAKLAPTVSPGKTWAGLFGGMVLATILGYFAAQGLGARHPAVSLILSPVLAVVAQLGDLFESYFKRRSGVKESGDLIPGHGGVLDRIDGLVFAGVFAALFQSALGQQTGWW